jgi:hypothetical protein
MSTKTFAFACWTALLLLGGSGCSGITGTAELPAPRTGEPPAANVASVPPPLDELFGFAPGALTSHASLVRMDDQATCFDVLIRRGLMVLPKDAQALPLQLSVEIDGVEATRWQQALPVCPLEGTCLPPDSSLQRFVAEDDLRVRVEGQRLCVEGLPHAQREIVLSANPGKGAWRFRFRFAGGQG